MAQKWDIVEADSPERCQASFSKGSQCHVRAEPNSQFCFRHQPGDHLKSGRRARLFRLKEYQSRFEEFINNPEIKTLHEEIGILRMQLETIINETGGNRGKLILFTSQIAHLVSNIKETLTAAHKLEQATGKLLDKTQVIVFGERIVSILSNYIKDPQVLESIAEEIDSAINDVGLLALENQNE